MMLSHQLLTVFFLMIAMSDAARPLCKPYQACAAIQHTYPLISPIESTTITIDTVESSGAGSGQHQLPPMLYDEFVSTPSGIFDIGAAPINTTISQLCDCPNNRTCPYNTTNDDHQRMQLDAFITLALCHPVHDQLPHECKGSRAVSRIIGRLDTSTELMHSIDDTLLFCSCPDGHSYTRDTTIEPWAHGSHAFTYRCA